MARSGHSPPSNPLTQFHPVVRSWFAETFPEPSPPQLLGWPGIIRGEHTLLLAPTGSGKTLAAFLWAINHLLEQHINGDFRSGVSVLYVSPLKALNNDIQRNLQGPLTAILKRATKEGFDIPPIRTAVRTGDTSQTERNRMLKSPPEILITTPESLYLMLTSRRAIPIFRSVQYLIIDEVHSLCGNKRGVHLSLSLERLTEVADQEFVRIGLSATQRPLKEIARYIGGQTWEGNNLIPRPVTVVDAGGKKEMDLKVQSPVPDFSTLPRDTVWPSLLQHILGLIRTHRNTLVFVNNRRLAERIAAELNDLMTDTEGARGLYHVPQTSRSEQERLRREAPEKHPIRAYHGSMSRESREQMETALKDGELKALIATSALELGIDIGSIDLVIQIESPKGVARGLQRVGRSGHVVTATSKGIVFPTHREDLVEAAVVGREMKHHRVEATSILRNCLDVLAQQIVAIVSVEEQDVDSLFDFVRRSYCYRDLPRTLFDGVIRMLSGRYASDTLRELRPRISWDKRNHLLRALPGSGRMAITGGGTIADRGYYGVYLGDGTTKIGEIDEEFVFESRSGDTFILGTDTWRISSIDPSRLTVTPAPGEPARMPFWRGERIGRTFELSLKVGEFRRELAHRFHDENCLKWIQDEFPVDHETAWQILEYARGQNQVAGSIPHDELILVEAFRDEIGDPRIVVHSCFGRRVNGMLGLFLVHAIQERTGSAPQMLYNDNGVLIRSSDPDDLPTDLLASISLSGALKAIMEEMPGSPLFGGQFRQNASRSLLMVRPLPGRRTPLWLQRLKAKDLLEVARKHDDFPIVIETVREILHDILDLDNFKKVIAGIENGKIQIRAVRTEIPSPFAATLMFDFISVYMYEWDRPKPDRSGAFKSVNQQLLGEILDLRDVDLPVRPDAVATVEAQLQHTADGFRARSPEELYELLLRIGDLSEEEILQRCEGDGGAYLQTLLADGRAATVTIGTDARVVAAEQAPLFRELQPESVPELLKQVLRSHGIVTADQIAGRYDLPEDVVTRAIARMETDGDVSRVPLQPEERAKAGWSYRPNLERIHRTTLSILRKEIQPIPLSDYAQFLIRWQHILRSEHGRDVAAEDCLRQLEGLPLPTVVWDRDILRLRIGSSGLDQVTSLTASGKIIWRGSAPGRIASFTRGELGAFASQSEEFSPGKSGGAIMAYLRAKGASFLSDIRGGTGLSLRALNRGLAELFWAGLVTNDLFAEILSVRRFQKESHEEPLDRIAIVSPRHNPHRGRLMRGTRQALEQAPGWDGRWSLIDSPAVTGPQRSLDQQARHQAGKLLDRYGIVAREIVSRESVLPWPMISRELGKLELRGEIRRGYFVKGLSGMQFGHRLAVEMIRGISRDSREALVLLNGCDPANPYGPGVPMEPSMPTFSRQPYHYMVLEQGSPVLVIENLGHRVWTRTEITGDILERSLRLFLVTYWSERGRRPFSELHLRYVNGARPGGSPFEPVLRKIGFYRDRDQTMRWSEYR